MPLLPEIAAAAQPLPTRAVISEVPGSGGLRSCTVVKGKRVITGSCGLGGRSRCLNGSQRLDGQYAVGPPWLLPQSDGRPPPIVGRNKKAKSQKRLLA
jgi:hypothetical protein